MSRTPGTSWCGAEVQSPELVLAEPGRQPGETFPRAPEVGNAADAGTGIGIPADNRGVHAVPDVHKKGACTRTVSRLRRRHPGGHCVVSCATVVIGEDTLLSVVVPLRVVIGADMCCLLLCDLDVIGADIVLYVKLPFRGGIRVHTCPFVFLSSPDRITEGLDSPVSMPLSSCRSIAAASLPRSGIL